MIGARLAPPAKNTRRDRSHGKHGGMLRLHKAIPRPLAVLSGTPNIRAYAAAPLRNTYRTQGDGEGATHNPVHPLSARARNRRTSSYQRLYRTTMVCPR